MSPVWGSGWLGKGQKPLWKQTQLSHNLEHTNYNPNYIYKEAEINFKKANWKQNLKNVWIRTSHEKLLIKLWCSLRKTTQYLMTGLVNKLHTYYVHTVIQEAFSGFLGNFQDSCTDTRVNMNCLYTRLKFTFLYRFYIFTYNLSEM